MAKTKKEEVVESTTKQEQPKVDNEVGKLKVKTKPKMKKLNQEDEVIKVDLKKPPTKDIVEEKQPESVENIL